MNNTVGYADTAELAWLFERYEKQRREECGECRCEECGLEYDPEDLVGGICESCAEELSEERIDDIDE